MSISAIGANYFTPNPSTILTVAPSTLGNILVVAGGCAQALTGDAFSSISGGGVTTWTTAKIGFMPNGETGLWWGVITTTGAANITVVTTTAAPTLCAQEFSTTGSGWGPDAGNATTGTGTPGTYPAVTPVGAGELYVGFIFESANIYAPNFTGSDAGFTYQSFNTIPSGIFDGLGQMVWNLNASNPTSYAPNWGGGGSSFTWGAVAGTITGSAATSQIVMLPFLP